MYIDSYIEQIIKVVKYQDERAARQHILLLLQAFAESISDLYNIDEKDRNITFDSVASKNRTKIK